MHVPAGERKQTGRAKENKFYSQKTFDETYYMITHSNHEMTEVSVLQSTLYISIINNHLPFPRLSVEILHTPNHIHWCAPGLVWLLHKNSGRFMEKCEPILFKFIRIERISLFKFSPATPIYFPFGFHLIFLSLRPLPWLLELSEFTLKESLNQINR